MPGTCHCPAHAEPIADFYWRRDSKDRNIDWHWWSAPHRIQGITACASAYDPHQVVQLCFHHQFQWRPCLIFFQRTGGQMTGNRALEETLKLKDRRLATCNSKLNFQTLPAMIVWFAFPMLISQFPPAEDKTNKYTYQNYHKNTRCWSLQSNAKQRHQLEKCFCVFLIQEGKATTSAKGKEFRRRVTS